MKDCTVVRDHILEVDPAELQSGASGDLAGHLDACSECRALADEILDAESALRAALGSIEPRTDVETALAKAKAAAVAPRRRHFWRVAAPVAVVAAAAVAGLVLIGRRPPAPTASGFDPATVAAAQALGLAKAGPVVESTTHSRVAILPTEDPNITIIWFMD